MYEYFLTWRPTYWRYICNFNTISLNFITSCCLFYNIKSTHIVYRILSPRVQDHIIILNNNDFDNWVKLMYMCILLCNLLYSNDTRSDESNTNVLSTHPVSNVCDRRSIDSEQNTQRLELCDIKWKWLNTGVAELLRGCQDHSVGQPGRPVVWHGVPDERTVRGLLQLGRHRRRSHQYRRPAAVLSGSKCSFVFYCFCRTRTFGLLVSYTITHRAPQANGRQRLNSDFSIGDGRVV